MPRAMVLIRHLRIRHALSQVSNPAKRDEPGDSMVREANLRKPLFENCCSATHQFRGAKLMD